MTRSLCLFAALFFVSPLLSAEIFKCTDDKGNTKYQNFPCPIDSIGSKATAAPPKEEEPAATGKPPATPDSARQAAVVEAAMRASEALIRAQAADRKHAGVLSGDEPRIGMTMDAVRAAAGEPLRTEASLDGDIWHYGYTRSGDTLTVLFDLQGRVRVVDMVE